MANADGKIIPLTEDDQGEGVKDPLTIDDIIRLGQYPVIPLKDMMLGNCCATKRVEFPGIRTDDDEPEAYWVDED